jgi:hypothetical protein
MAIRVSRDRVGGKIHFDLRGSFFYDALMTSHQITESISRQLDKWLNISHSYMSFPVNSMKKKWMLTILFLNLGFANAQCKVYSGSTGYAVAARVEVGKVYSGSSGYNVVARFENGKVYSGSSGYTVMARVEGNKIYGGSSGHNVIGRIDGDKIYLGSTGYKVAARSEGCGGMSFAAAAAACCL